MVATAEPAPPRETRPNRPGDVIYEEVPAGLITLADAAEKYQVRHNTLNVAVSRGMLPIAGRTTRRHGFGKSGGERHNVVSEAALRRYLGLPPEPAAPTDNGGRPWPDALLIYDAAPEGMISVPAAARKYRVPANRLHQWIQGDRLARQGYLRDGRRGRSALLVVEAEVAAMAKAWQI